MRKKKSLKGRGRVRGSEVYGERMKGHMQLSQWGSFLDFAELW